MNTSHIKTLDPGTVKYRDGVDKAASITDRLEIHESWVKVCGDAYIVAKWIPREKIVQVKEE